MWVTKPWWRPWLGLRNEVAVTIEPVGLIEGGKVKDVESGPIANQLRHRLTQISDVLSRDLSEHYKVLSAGGFSIPEVQSPGFENFMPPSDTDLSFEVEVFKFDIAGLFTFINRRLDARDSIKIMIELGAPKSKLFLDVARVAGDPQRQILDGGSTLNDVIDVAACAIMQAYRKKDNQFEGLDAKQFCALFKVIEDFHAFIIQYANAFKHDGKADLTKASGIAARLEADPFVSADSPVIHVMLAGLYRLLGDSAKALGRLERAAAMTPSHKFVLANLTAWRQEQDVRKAQVQDLAAAKNAPAATDEVETTYITIREQSELVRIKYPEMLERLKSLPIPAEVVVAVFGTGFTVPANPASQPKILKALTVLDKPGTDDLNGHGNMTTHLLAALTPRNRLNILPVKVLSDSGEGQTTDILAGFEKAASLNADIFLIPLGMDATGELAKSSASLYQRVFDTSGAITVAAAGNNSMRDQNLIGAVNLPASIPSTVAVGGTAADGSWANFSPGPEGVDVSAPAVGILTSLTGSDMRMMTGTSFSTVIVAALFALARSVDADLSQAEILEALTGTAVPGKDGGPPTIDALAFIERVAAIERSR